MSMADHTHALTRLLLGIVLACLATVAWALPMSGTYTIGGANSHFATLQEATNALRADGVDGPVLFNIRPGVYEGPVSVPDIAGASAANTITFQSETGSVDDVLVQYQSIDPEKTALAVWQVTGDYVTIQNLTLQQMTAFNSTYGRVLEVSGDADHVRILHNRLIGTTQTTTIQDRFAVLFNWKTSTYAADDVLVEGNEMLNGSVGIYWGGSSLFSGSGLRIRNNSIRDFGMNGIQLLKEPAAEISGNTISTTATYSTYPYGLILDSCDGAIRVEKNRIALDKYSGVYIKKSHATQAAPGLIANNFIRVGAPSQLGLSLSESDYQKVVHNSVTTTANMPGYAALYIYYGSHNTLLNNIAVDNGVGSAIKLTYYPDPGLDVSDYNLLHAASGFVGITGTFTQHATLADWQAATGLDAHSIEAVPLFAAADDLHLAAGSPGIDQALTGQIPDDIDYAPRPALADIGADEYGYAACLFTASVRHANCPANDGGIDLINIAGIPPYSFAWSDGASSEDRTGLAAGTYSVTVTGPTGCNWSGNFEVGCNPPPPPLDLGGIAQPVSCAGACDGQTDVSASGGCPAYNYFLKAPGSSWQPSTGHAGSLCPGTYVWAAKDQCGALDTTYFTITQPTPLQPSLVSLENVSCKGANDGSFEVGLAGGNPPYQFSKDGGTTWQASGYFDALAPGVYNVYFKDATSCERNIDLPITEPPRLLLRVVNVVNESSPGAADGSVQVAAYGGTGNYEYSRDGGATWQSSPLFTGLTAGNYVIRVQDENSCQTMALGVVGSGG